MVVAVRGTQLGGNCYNLQDDMRLALNKIPDLIDPLLHAIQHLDLGSRRMYLTGHSLGATAVNIAFLRMVASDETWLQQLGLIVLFENPGVPRHVLESLPKDLIDAASAKVVEFFGAPNPINMWHPHMGALKVRVLLSHGQSSNWHHVSKCARNSLGRAAAVVGVTATAGMVAVATTTAAGTTAAGVAATSAGTELATGATFTGVTAAGAASCGMLIGTFNAFLGVEDIVRWTLGQHSITTIHGAFDLGAYMPREFRLIKKWPDGMSSLNTIKGMATSVVPFHPANYGLHTVKSPDAVVEARIRSIIGYEEYSE